jgi:hypothetical protein
MRGLNCEDKLLGPKTEFKKVSQISESDLTIPRLGGPVPCPDDAALTELESALLRMYLDRDGFCLPCPHAPQFRDSDAANTQIFTLIRLSENRRVWLALHCNSKPIRFAMISAATNWTRKDRNPCRPDLKKAYAALRQAISSELHFEIAYTCDFLCFLERAQLDRYVTHISGMWAALKCLIITRHAVSRMDGAILKFMLLSQLYNFAASLDFAIAGHSALTAWSPEVTKVLAQSSIIVSISRPGICLTLHVPSSTSQRWDI